MTDRDWRRNCPHCTRDVGPAAIDELDALMASHLAFCPMAQVKRQIAAESAVPRWKRWWLRRRHLRAMYNDHRAGFLDDAVFERSFKKESSRWAELLDRLE